MKYIASCGAVLLAAVPAAAQVCAPPFEGAVYSAATVDSPPVLADFDLDGDLDLATLTAYTDAVLLLENLGQGVLSEPTAVANLSPAVTELAAGDFDGDGDIDLAVGRTGSGGIRLLWNDGTGAFPSSGSVDTLQPSAPHVAAADLDGDGVADLVAGGPQALVVLLADAAGGFLPPVTATTALPLRDVLVGDNSGDSRPEVFAVTYASAFATLEVYANDGNGALLAPAFVAIGLLEAALALADFNADGRADFAAISADGSVVRTALYAGGGYPTLKQHFLASASLTQHLSAGPLSGDAFDDVYANGHVLRSLGNGDFESSTASHLLASYAAFGKLDADSLEDVVVQAAGDTDWIVWTPEPGKLAGAPRFPSPWALVSEPIAADLDDDGFSDFAAVGGLTIGSFMGSSAGFTGTQLLTPLEHAYDRMGGVGDLDLDGDLDAVVFQALAAEVAYGNGLGRFTQGFAAIPLSGIGLLREAAVFDANSDGWDDVVLSGAAAAGGALAVRLLHSAAGPLFVPAYFQTFPGEETDSGLATGDLDLDSERDLLLGGDVALRADGLGSFAQVSVPAVGAVATIADLDGDGDADLAGLDPLHSELRVALGQAGGFAIPVAYSAAPTSPLTAAKRLHAMEAGGGSALDLVATGAIIATVWHGDGAGGFARVESQRTGALTDAVPYDANADTRLDLVGIFGAGAPFFVGSVTLCLREAGAAFATIYGSGKPGANGIPVLAGSSPVLGAPAQLILGNGLPGAAPWLLVGFAPASQPFDGGQLSVLPSLALPLPAFDGTGQIALPLLLPDDPSLCGASAYFQALFQDPAAAGPYHTAQTRGLAWTFEF